MKKFIIEYYGHTEPSKEAMDTWMAWFKTITDHIVEIGSPLGEGAEVTAKSSKPITSDMWPATGYSIIQAQDMASAIELVKNCPGISGTDEKGALRIYELTPM